MHSLGQSVGRYYIRRLMDRRVLKKIPFLAGKLQVRILLPVWNETQKITKVYPGHITY
jgi:hypothetical protein